MAGPVIGLANFKKQWAESREAYQAAIERVGQSGWLILGSEVAAFEADLSAHWGLAHAVGCASGLDALELAFRCLGMQAGDLVLTTPLSAFATTLAIVRVGAVPVFADVDESGQLDLQHAAMVLKTLPQKARFVVPVHLFGHALNLNAIEAFALRHELVIVEDCAQAIGARSGGRAVGSLAPVCATSFYPTKNLGAFGDAGALLTNDPAINALARSLRDYGQSAKYVHSELGLNSRLDELQAALLRSVQLPALKAQTERRRVIAARYQANLRNAALALVPVPAESESVWHLFPVLVKNAASRAAFQAHLKGHGIESAVHYPKLIPDQPAMAKTRWLGAGGDALPRARQFAETEVSLPMHPFLTEAEVQQVIEACNSWEAP